MNKTITIFGTCRLNLINNHNNINTDINYCHSSKEVMQLIKFLKGELIIPIPYNKLCFKTAIHENTYLYYNDIHNKMFLDTDVFIIEICSINKFVHNNFYLHHLSVDKRFPDCHTTTPREILDNFILEKQSDVEIETDVLEIQKMLYPKKIIIVSHYNSKLNDEYIPSRNNLINLLDTICTKHNIPFVNPTKVLSNFTQEQVIKSDLGHYTELGIREFTNYMNNYLQTEL